MKPLRMRATQRSVLSIVAVGLGLALVAGPALADKKKPAGGGAKGGGDAGGEIEMGGDAKKPAGGGAGAGSGGAAGGAAGDVNPDEIDMGAEDKPQPAGDLSADIAAADSANTVVKAGPLKKTPLSWKDILVVIRKPFLKVRRTELSPMFSTTMNDNMVRHYTVGGELAYYLTDVLAVGVEGHYYVKSFGEPFDLVARQARRLPTINQYKWSAALDFHYVPVYGKFAVLDRRLVTWEAYFTAGIGAGQSEVVPRDTKFPGFTNLLIMPNIGASMRFFLAKWLTVNVGIRDYVFYDHFEPTDRSPTMNATAQEAKDHSDGALINNVMFQVGISFWLPTTFEYTTFR
jgi:outer membrane beta-barrel protein